MPGFIGAMARPDSSGAGTLSSYGKRHEPLERDDVFPYDRDNTYGTPGAHDRTMPGKNTRGLVPRDAEENPWDELEEMVLTVEAKERPEKIQIIRGYHLIDGHEEAWAAWKHDFGGDETSAKDAIGKWKFAVTPETVVAFETFEPFRKIAWTEEDQIWDAIPYKKLRVSPEQRAEIEAAEKILGSTNEAKDRPEEITLDFVQQKFPGALNSLQRGFGDFKGFEFSVDGDKLFVEYSTEEDGDYREQWNEENRRWYIVWQSDPAVYEAKDRPTKPVLVGPNKLANVAPEASRYWGRGTTYGLPIRKWVFAVLEDGTVIATPALSRGNRKQTGWAVHVFRNDGYNEWDSISPQARSFEDIESVLELLRTEPLDEAKERPDWRHLAISFEEFQSAHPVAADQLEDSVEWPEHYRIVSRDDSALAYNPYTGERLIWFKEKKGWHGKQWIVSPRGDVLPSEDQKRRFYELEEILDSNEIDVNEITGYPVSFTKQDQGGGRTLPGTSGGWSTGWTEDGPDEEEIEKAGAGNTKHARGPGGRTFATGANMHMRGMIRREAKERPENTEVFDFEDLENVNPQALDAWEDDPAFYGNKGEGWICAAAPSGVVLTLSSHPSVAAGDSDNYLVFNPKRSARPKHGWMTWGYAMHYFPEMKAEATRLRDAIRFHKEEKIGEAKERPEEADYKKILQGYWDASDEFHSKKDPWSGPELKTMIDALDVVHGELEGVLSADLLDYITWIVDQEEFHESDDAAMKVADELGVSWSGKNLPEKSDKLHKVWLDETKDRPEELPPEAERKLRPFLDGGWYLEEVELDYGEYCVKLVHDSPSREVYLRWEDGTWVVDSRISNVMREAKDRPKTFDTFMRLGDESLKKRGMNPLPADVKDTVAAAIEPAVEALLDGSVTFDHALNDSEYHIFRALKSGFDRHPYDSLAKQWAWGVLSTIEKQKNEAAEMKTPWKILEAFVSLRSTPSEPMGLGQSIDDMELDAKRNEFRNAFDRSLEIVTKLPESEVMRLIVDLDPEYAADEFLGGMGSEELSDIYQAWGDMVAPPTDELEADETDDEIDALDSL